MPYIAPLKEDQVITQGSPVPVGSAESARVGGEAIQALGQGVQQAAAGVGDYLAKKQQADRTISLAKFSADATAHAQKTMDDAQTNAAPDGSNLVSGFQDKFKDWTDNNADQFSDPDLKEMAKIKAQDIQNEYSKNLFSEAQKLHAQNAVDQTEAIKNTTATSIFNDPSQYQKGYSDYIATVMKSGVYQQKDLPTVMTVAKTDLATAAMNGFIDKKDYAGAKNFLNTTASDVFDAKAKQQLYDHIDTEATKDLENQMRVISFQNAQAKQQQEKEQKANFASAMNAVTNAQTVGDKLAIQKKINLQVGNQTMEPTEARFIKEVISESEGTNDDRLGFQFATRLNSGQNLGQLRQDIISSVNGNQMTAKKGMVMLNAVDAQMRRIDTDPVQKAKFKQANALMDSAFGADMFDKLMPAEAKAHKADAVLHMNGMINSGMDPVDAARASIKLYGTELQAIPYAPGAHFSKQDSLEGIAEAATEIDTKKQQGQMSSKEALEALRILNSRKQAIRNQQLLDQQTAARKKNK